MRMIWNWEPGFFTKERLTDKIWRFRSIPKCYDDRMEFSFNLIRIYNYYEDYPQNLTPREKEIFDKAYPYWANGGFYKNDPAEDDLLD